MSREAIHKTIGSGPEPIFQTMLMSDLHLELDETVIPDFPAVAPILLLAGDIGRPDIPSLQKFLLEQCQRFQHIFYVAGNHCFYDGEYEDRLRQLRQLDQLDPRIHFLQNKSYLLPNNVRILGTTLWSHVHPENASRISQGHIDYRIVSIIKEKEIAGNKITIQHPITVDDTNEWHAQQHAWLLQEIRKARENREHVVIITHHVPIRQAVCSKGYAESGFADAYFNDHEADCMEPVRLWVHGHTHEPSDVIVNSTRVISNQLGYLGENCGFRPNMKITLYNDGSVTVADAFSFDY